MTAMPDITGQIIFRDAYFDKHNPSPAPKGKKIMMFVGLVIVPEDTDIKGEHQYVIYGKEQKDLLSTGLVVMTDTGQDLTKTIQGFNIGQTLTQPIWRI